MDFLGPVYSLIYITVHPSATIKDLLVKLLLSGSLGNTFGDGIGIELNFKQKQRFQDVLIALIADVERDEQGVTELAQRSALACMEKQTAKLEKSIENDSGSTILHLF